MPRVLIVTSMFLPYLAADMHRARLLAAELPAQGWEVELLVPGDAFQNAAHFQPDAELLEVAVPVHRAEPEWRWVFASLNARSLGTCAYRSLRRLGDTLLSSGRFDLVYISCSQHAFFHLGVGWKRRHHIPYVLDFHDPWYTERLPPAKHLAGFRRMLANRLAQGMESAALRHACGLVSVSLTYLETLNARYRGLDWLALQPHRQAVVPFAASDRDYVAAGQLACTEIDEDSMGNRTIVYAGAGGTIMEESFRHLCRLLLEVRRREPLLLAAVRIQLFGTEGYAAGPIPTLTRVAEEAGLAGLVSEFPARVSYLEALRRVTEADGLLVLGIDSAGYNPSKLFLYGATGKPLLACLRADSVVDEYFRQSPELGHLVHFGGAGTGDFESVIAFLREVSGRGAPSREGVRKRWLGEEMARRHAEFFRECLRNASGNLGVASA